MGDVIAAVPVVKYMIEKYHADGSYMVVAKEMFKPFFHFVPEDKFQNYENKENDWGIPNTFAIAALNQTKVKSIVRNTPRMMHLGQFAALKFANRYFNEADLKYIPLINEDISTFDSVRDS